MASRSLNKVTLIGNLTRDPELRYTPSGAAVCTIGIATNRTWTTDSGEKKEEVEFHRIIAWNKLADLCSQLLTKGRKIYAEGRLRTNTWQAKDGTERNTTEIILEDMIILDSRKPGEAGISEAAAPKTGSASVHPAPATDDATTTSAPKPSAVNEDVNPDDIPF